MPRASSKVDLIPVIESGVFNNHAGARFAVGVVAVDNAIVNGYDTEFQGMADLRAGVYLDKGFVTAEQLDANGTELDDDDERSVHFVVLENMARNSLARVVGNMRLVVKSDANASRLPIEKYCPDAFDEAASYGSTEASRLITVHESALAQTALKWPLFSAGLNYVNDNNLGPIYGLVEPRWVSSLARQHFPVTTLAGERYIPDINAIKQPIEIDVRKLQSAIDFSSSQTIDVKGGFSYVGLGSSKRKDEQLEKEIA